MTSKKFDASQNESHLRLPKQKKKLGLIVPSIKLPHDELFKPEIQEIEKPSKSLTGQTRQTTQTRHTSQTTQTRQSSQTRQTRLDPIAPGKNFQKVPNSITKEAIPAGFFKGKAKQLYDVLYALTRGAIVPVRTTRIRKSELMKKAHIGSRNTFDINIKHLQAVGLLRETVLIGEHAGNEFEVFTVEEISTLPSLPSQTSVTGQSQKLVSLVTPETSQTRQRLNISEENSYEDLKTFFKTFSFIDDEAPLMRSLIQLNEAARGVTGRDLTTKDWEAFSELIELIINETAIARTRTHSVSIYLKFAAENLRRRLYTRSTQQKQKRFEPGKPETFISSEPQISETEPMNEAAREVVLESLQQIKSKNGMEAIEIFREIYTDEDWNWLKENL